MCDRHERHTPELFQLQHQAHIPVLPGSHTTDLQVISRRPQTQACKVQGSRRRGQSAGLRQPRPSHNKAEGAPQSHDRVGQVVHTAACCHLSTDQHGDARSGLQAAGHAKPPSCSGRASAHMQAVVVSTCPRGPKGEGSPAHHCCRGCPGGFQVLRKLQLVCRNRAGQSPVA